MSDDFLDTKVSIYDDDAYFTPKLLNMFRCRYILSSFSLPTVELLGDYYRIRYGSSTSRFALPVRGKLSSRYHAECATTLIDYWASNSSGDIDYFFIIDWRKRHEHYSLFYRRC